MADSLTPPRPGSYLRNRTTRAASDFSGDQASGGWRASIRQRAYHVGNLRATLLDDARVLLLERGITGLNLRALSNRSGVALGSVYHHFDSKAGLLAAVVAQGFEELSAEISQAAATSQGQVIRKCAHVYFAFARREPELYSLMFAHHMSDDPTVSSARVTTFEAFKRILESLGPHAAVEDIQDVALAVWASAHGAATLGPVDAEGESLMEAVIRGLELLFRPRSRVTGVSG